MTSINSAIDFYQSQAWAVFSILHPECSVSTKFYFFIMKILTIFVLALLPVVTYAHGGHGFFDPHTLLHYLGNPEHAIPIFALIALAVGVWYKRYRKSRI